MAEPDVSEQAGVREQADDSEPPDGAEPGLDAADPADRRRTELIAAAQARWVAALTDLGGRNTLLYYKDRRAGTLDLAAADPAALEKFLRTGSIRLTRLFHDVDARADAIRRVQVIYRKARELLEERGIRAGYLAAGLARWDELFLEPAAPVLLRGLTITPTRARYDDFELVLDDDYRRKVLFVAEKRAAIDAVLSRLKGVGLGGMVLEIHEGTRDRLRIARDLGDTLDEAQRTPAPDLTDLHRRLVDRQDRLSQHATALHEVHKPWGLTPFEVQAALLGAPAEARTPVRLAAPEQLTREAADRIRDELREFAHLGGFTLRPGSTPWYGAALRTPDQARQAGDIAARLSSHELPALLHRVARAAAGTGLRPPRAYPDAVAQLRLYAGVARTQRRLGPAVVHQLVPEPAGRGGPAAGRLPAGGRGRRAACRGSAARRAAPGHAAGTR